MNRKIPNEIYALISLENEEDRIDCAFETKEDAQKTLRSLEPFVNIDEFEIVKYGRMMPLPAQCFPDENLANVEEAAIQAGKTGDVWIANESIAGMAREIREWRELARKFLLPK